MENETDIKNTIIDQYKALPPALQYAIGSYEVKTMLSDIKNKYTLTDEEDITVSNEVLYIFFGSSNPSDFQNNLIKENIPKDKAIIINKDVKESIFIPLKEELGEIYTQEKDTKENISINHEEDSKDTILHDIEEPKSFDVPFKKTTFEEKLGEPVPETKEGMLEQLKTPSKDALMPQKNYDNNKQLQDLPIKKVPSNTELNHDLFPQPKKDLKDSVGTDPYREQIE